MILISPNIEIYNQNSNKVKPLKNFNGTDVSDILSKGNKALNENKFNEALKYYNQALNKNPDEIKIYRQMAKAQFGLKNYAEAGIKDVHGYICDVTDEAAEIGRAHV